MTFVKEMRIEAKRQGLLRYYEMTKYQLEAVLSNKEKIPEIMKEMVIKW